MFENTGGNPSNEDALKLSSQQSKEIAEKIRDRLVVDSVSLLQELIELSRDHISLEENGRVHINSPEQLKGTELVSLVLIGKSLARLGGLCANDLVDTSEIAEATGQKEDVVNARLSELRKIGVAESPDRGKHRITSLAKARTLLLTIRQSAVHKER